MCRLLLAAISREAAYTLAQLLDAYRKAVWSDPLLERVWGVKSHCDGVGVVVALAIGGSWGIYYERFDAYGHASDPCMANLSALDVMLGRIREAIIGGGWDRLVLMIHSRRASGGPRGTLYAHPFHYSVASPNGVIDLFFSHNGSVNKKRLADTLDVRGSLSMYSDSFLAGLHLSNTLARGHNIVAGVKSLSRFVKPLSALNLNMLVLSSDGEKTKVKAYAVGLLGHEARNDPNRQAYYEPVLVEGRGLIGYVSSTVRDYGSGIRGLTFSVLGDRLVEIDPIALTYNVVKL